MKNINAIFDDKTYNEDLKNTIWKFFSAVVDAKKEERLKIISNLRKLAIMIGYDEKAIECIDNFLGVLEGKDGLRQAYETGKGYKWNKKSRNL